MKSKTGIIIVIIVIAALGYWYWSVKGTPFVSAPTTTINEAADTTADINTDVQNINIGDLNGDLENIDKDISTL